MSQLLFLLILIAIPPTIQSKTLSLAEPVKQPEHIMVTLVPPELQNQKKTVEISSKVGFSLYYTHTLFEKPLVIINSKVTNPANLNYSRFEDNVIIENTNFSQPLQVQLSLFNAPAAFKYSNFMKGALFYNSRFQSFFELYRTYCTGICSWNNAYFNHNANFNYNNFIGDTHFNMAYFSKNASFKNSEFYQAANFSHVIFSNSVNFDNAIFDKDANFQGTTFNGQVSFNNTVFGGTLNLSHLILDTTLDLTNTKPLHYGEKIFINLLETDISKIKMDYINFSLIFPENALSSDKQLVYESLLHQFKTQGMEQNYNQLYKEYKEWSYLQTNSYLINIISKFWWGYGLEKERIPYWALLILIIFTSINASLYRQLAEFFPEIRLHRENNIKKLPSIIHYFYCLPRALLLTIYICFGGVINIFTTRFSTKSFWMSFYLFTMFTFGFICFLFVVQWIITGVFR